MYNVKTRQARAAFPGGNRPAPDARRWTEECPMLMSSVLNSILGLDIILVLVLVVLVPKKNSAFGHARNKGALNGFLPSGM